MPWARFAQHEGAVKDLVAQETPVVVVCRRGNDSQRALRRMQELGLTTGKDLLGGMEAWAREADPSFPLY